jgi:hypothetical protein
VNDGSRPLSRTNFSITEQTAEFGGGSVLANSDEDCADVTWGEMAATRITAATHLYQPGVLFETDPAAFMTY